MDMGLLLSLLPTLGTLVVIGLCTLAISWWLRLERSWLQPWAILRAMVQLALLSVVLSGALGNIRWTGAFLALMAGAAAWTVRQRLDMKVVQLPLIALILLLGAGVPSVLLFVMGVLPFEGRYLLSIGGILIGHAMTVSTLMGREVTQALSTHVSEVEGWLALGAPMRVATKPVMQRAGSTAVIPNTDQTRNIGVITLPGAFVGAVFGGASVFEAGRFQLVVSTSILFLGVLVVAMWTLVLGNPKTITR